VVVVTGANEGVGYHLMDSLLALGFRVAGLDVNGENVERLANTYGERARYVKCDVSETDEVETAIDAVLDEWGRIDVLVNNAAVFELAPFEERTLDGIRREFEVNYFGYLRTIRAVLPHMRERGSGKIHNVSSGVGIVGSPRLSGYASTKDAVEALVRSLRTELADEGIDVTLVHPPYTNTRSARELGYPEWMTSDPAVVGRKLARKIDATGPVVYADWSVRIGLALARLFPSLVRRGTEVFAESVPGDDVSAGDGDSGEKLRARERTNEQPESTSPHE
jgi:NAD(P)-dependent dehydrogenase (short-subunit alcohol dehydrogenase family)